MTRSDGTPNPLGIDREEFDRLCEEDEANLKERIARLREIRAYGHYTALDELVGVYRGEIARFLGGNRVLNHEQLNRLIRFLTGEPLKLEARAEQPVCHSFATTDSYSGLLPRLVGRPQEKDLPSWFELLRSWAETATVRNDGSHFEPDPNDLIALRLKDLDAAERFAIGSLEHFLYFSDGTISAGSAPSFARWLVVLGSMLRAKGQRPMAAKLFDVSISLEEAMSDAACGSFILRNACYLLSDSGHLDLAAECAERAVVMAVRAGDLCDLGLSQYALAAMADRTGRSSLAIEMYLSAANFLPETQVEAKVGIAQALAVLYIQQKKFAAAEVVLEKLGEDCLQCAGPLASAKVWVAKAELASHQRRHEEAGTLFSLADRALAECGAISEQSVVRLYEVRHHLRHKQYSVIPEQARRLIELGQDRRQDKSGRALLLETARLLLQGKIDSIRLSMTVEDWLASRTARSQG